MYRTPIIPLYLNTLYQHDQSVNFHSCKLDSASKNHFHATFLLMCMDTLSPEQLNSLVLVIMCVTLYESAIFVTKVNVLLLLMFRVDEITDSIRSS